MTAIACRTTNSCAARCEYAKMFDLPVMDHCQDYSLVTDGVMHEGYWSTVLGLRGWPAAGEEMIVARNILLAELTGARVHCQHLSAAGSVALLREAKKRGVPISGEACPHHFTLTDAAVAGSERFWANDGKTLAGFQDELPEWPAYDTNFKMNPPLALGPRPRGDSGRAGGRHDRDSLQRPRAALRLREGSGVRLRAVRHHRPGNRTGAVADAARTTRSGWVCPN